VITDFGLELSARTPQPSQSRSVCASAPFRDAIELGLSHGRNAMAIWQDLVDTSGFTGSYQSVQPLSASCVQATRRNRAR
jgi:hypothetical protein